ncbi:MAG: hypothetical protein EOO15_12640 [Chitinophagaceae bacterium]|nr:MAG: hypothetical protein EOO15_12640 [Chitinophagaceae bacterium]
MKLLTALLGLLLIGQTAVAQLAPDSLPYQRFPTLPPLQLLLGDSTTLFTKETLPKKKGTLIIYFSTGCHHCQTTTEQLLKNKDHLPDINIVMATFASISDMNSFRSRYGTDSLPNTFVGKDIHFLLPSFYGIANLPFMAYYNRKGDFVELLNGPMPVSMIMDRIRELDKARK